MDVLRNFIRNLITEAALSPKDMPDTFSVVIKQLGTKLVSVQLVDSNSEKLVGEIGMHKAGGSGYDEEDESGDDGPCSGAWIISSTHAQHGWGPLIYDIAIEYATMHGAGLTPDRESVSDDAYAVWDYYLKRRSDVKAHQLDSKKNILTPSSADNCAQMSTATYANGKFEKDIDAKDLTGSPLSKYYSKAPTTINLLKGLGKIRIGK